MLAKPLHVWLVAVAGLAAAVPPAALVASCQTRFCYQQRWQADLDSISELQRELEAHPLSQESWRRLSSAISGQADHVRAVAVYRSRFEWRLDERLARGAEIESQAEEEGRAWRERWRRARPQDCAAWQDDLQGLADRALENPEEVTVQHCWVERLMALRDPAAIERAQALVVRWPDDRDSHRWLVRAALVVGNPEQVRAAIREQARQFPDDEEARYELLGLLQKEGPEDERVAYERELFDSIATPADGSFCTVLKGASEQEACYRAVLRSAGAEQIAEEGWRAQQARDRLLARAIDGNNWAEIEGLLADSPPEQLVHAWHQVLDRLKGDACPRFLASHREGRFAASLEDPSASAWVPISLARRLRECGATDQAHAVLDRVEPSTRHLALTERGGLALLEEQRAIAKIEDPKYARYRLDMAMKGRPATERVPYLLGRLSEEPGRQPLQQDLVTSLEEIADTTQVRVQGRQAVDLLTASATNGRLDLALQLAFILLRRGEELETRSLATWAYGEGDASPRQQAEAEFLLARLELRRGDVDTAVDRFERYFLLRQRFGECRECDRGFALLLARLFDFDRLAGYREQRSKARAEFECLAAAEWAGRRRTTVADAWPTEIVESAACADEDDLARIAARLAARGDDARLRQQLARARAAARPCPSAWRIEAALDGAKSEEIWRYLTIVN